MRLLTLANDSLRSTHLSQARLSCAVQPRALSCSLSIFTQTARRAEAPCFRCRSSSGPKEAKQRTLRPSTHSVLAKRGEKPSWGATQAQIASPPHQTPKNHADRLTDEKHRARLAALSRIEVERDSRPVGLLVPVLTTTAADIHPLLPPSLALLPPPDQRVRHHTNTLATRTSGGSRVPSC